MVIVLSNNRCLVCGKKRIKNPDCLGDYHDTVTGYRLQEYCNGDCELNGVLYPLLRGRDPNIISNRSKKSFAVTVAVVYRRGFMETKKIALSCDTNITKKFLIMFAEKTRLPLSEVSNFLE